MPIKYAMFKQFQDIADLKNKKLKKLILERSIMFYGLSLSLDHIPP
jgi:hypothetical protein